MDLLAGDFSDRFVIRKLKNYPDLAHECLGGYKNTYGQLLARAPASMTAYMGGNNYVFKKLARALFSYTGLGILAPEYVLRIQKTIFIADDYKTLEYVTETMKR